MTVRVELGGGQYADLEPDVYEVDRSLVEDGPIVGPVLQIGDRVRLKHPVDRYPHFLADAGETGTVTHTPAGDPAGTLCVRMDVEIAGAEDWENEIVWSVGDGDDPLRDLELVEEPVSSSDASAWRLDPGAM